MKYYSEIKELLINNEIYKRTKDYSKNRNELMTYFNVGKLIIKAQSGDERAKYGDNLIKEYSKKLTNELGKGYSERNLKYMRKFYLFQKGQPAVAQLSWSHYIVLMSIKDNEKIEYYTKQCIKYNWSRDELKKKIKSKEYERLPSETKNKLIQNKDINIEDFIKNPIVINTNGKEIVSEKILKSLILEDIPRFMKELGDGFSFIDSEYKIKLGNRYNYIDLLLYNIIYKCYVVIELKITELKAEHIGQIKKYMNYIDKHIKTGFEDKTIGIIIVKKDNDFIMEYCSDERIYKTSYITN